MLLAFNLTEIKFLFAGSCLGPIMVERTGLTNTLADRPPMS
jgi:hypothetical protein